MSIGFDHHAPGFMERSAALYEELRAHCPVAHSETYGGFWLLSRYADVSRAARDPQTFSSARQVIVPANDVPPLIPLNSDAPDLRRYRTLLRPYFDRSAVEALTPFVERALDELLSAVRSRPRWELVEELANPLPAMTTMELLGLDPADWRFFADPLHALNYSTPGSDEHERAQEAAAGFDARIAAEVDARVRRPREDMISELLTSSYDGRRTTRDEVVALVRMIVFAGMDTVKAALTNALFHIGVHDDLRRRLVDEPALVPSAVEELLRFEAPIQGFARTVVHDVAVGDQRLAEGDTVFLLWASANRDSEVFADPDRIALERDARRHLSFGVGPHRCLGEALARRQLQLAVARVLEQMPDYRVLVDEVELPDSVGIVFARRRVPIARDVPA